MKSISGKDADARLKRDLSARTGHGADVLVQRRRIRHRLFDRLPFRSSPVPRRRGIRINPQSAPPLGVNGW
jgi:hypothetical protein